MIENRSAESCTPTAAATVGISAPEASWGTEAWGSAAKIRSSRSVSTAPAAEASFTADYNTVRRAAKTCSSSSSEAAPATCRLWAAITGAASTTNATTTAAYNTAGAKATSRSYA